MTKAMYIRCATLDDLPSIEQVARQFPAELGWVRRAGLKDAQSRGNLHVAIADDQLVGFVNYRARRDGWQTIYDLAVDPAAMGQGIGRALLYSVPCPLRLKCTQDNLRANRFYDHAGLRLVGHESGRKRTLNIYEMRVLTILVAGNNPALPEIARHSAHAYGSSENDTLYGWPFMLDVDWKNPDWGGYIKKIAQWRPVQAMTIDYESPTQRDSLALQIDDLRRAGMLRIMVCPKFPGAITHIPRDCIVALSTPTADKASKFAGWLPPPADWPALKGRRVHLLGGAPAQQRALIERVALYGGRVISTDGNSHLVATGSVWEAGRWQRPRDGSWQYGNLADTRVASGRNIHAFLNDPDPFADATKRVRNRRAKQYQLPLPGL